ncbi:hydrogenase subunit MbhD domain-containing protein [Oceanirhabdus sp. W0125-5]|uniref:hydrogenase subunit MbhD domain-containing protein n=1 Tax=Oceanirhabdus sp. W0125-5 TaxID=2999116 RepID=UPI0022F2E932|nr:hydrogenase subunit MbhD domain-containing protein [Oceanirhabdus sp. W0125-5]WBW95390.1 DUF4040 domain-containing protein [Oceanirhabdus sp. W0125-5]
MTNFEVLNTVVIVGMIIAGFLTVILEDTMASIIALVAVGTFVALEFLLLKAPDVALAEGVVGVILTPVIFLIALSKSKEKSVKKEGE